MTSAAPAEVTVCIVTRARPDGLSRLLRALAGVEPPVALRWTATVVVDNDPGGSAAAVVDGFRAPGRFPTPIDYVVEPEPGVSHGRNTAVRRAATPWVAFIDDDMEPSPGWLAGLARGVTAHRAGAAIGPVPIRFESSPPEGLVDSGALDFPRWTDGELIDTVRTGNVILAVDRLPEPPFEVRLARCGGEDHLLGRQLHAAGVPVVYVADAEAWEWTPGERLTASALRKRQTRIGYAFVAVERLTRRWPVPGLGPIVVTGRAAARLAVGAALSAPFLPAARRWRGHQLLWFGVGELRALAGRPLRYYGS
ncbi:MAG: glycosyltransferase family A protein [Acidimicrobiales bacterium]